MPHYYILVVSVSDCNSTIELTAASGIQGTLRTPFFPSYYPPDTNCSWSFTVRHSFIHTSSTSWLIPLCIHEFHVSMFVVIVPHVISDARGGDGLVSRIWGLWAEPSQLQRGLYPGAVDHPEPQVGCAEISPAWVLTLTCCQITAQAAVQVSLADFSFYNKIQITFFLPKRLNLRTRLIPLCACLSLLSFPWHQTTCRWWQYIDIFIFVFLLLGDFCAIEGREIGKKAVAW